MRYFTVGFFALLFLTSRTLAATWIVDRKASSASDTNPGTRAQPFKTIGAAARIARPGDTVLVRPGVYREAVHLSVSGTKGKPITFRSEVAYAAILEGADVVTTFAPETAGVWSFSAPTIEALGHDPNAGEWLPGDVVYSDGTPLTRVTDKSRLSPGTFFLAYDRKRVLFAPYENQTPQQIKVEFTVRNGLLAAEKPIDDIHIQGFTLIHNGDWFGNLHALTICGQRWLVENNHILWSSYAGIAFRHSNRCVARNNLVDWSGAEDVVGNTTTNLLFENNRLLHGNWQRQEPGFEGGALKMVSTYDSLYKNNEAAYFYGYGLWFDIGCGNNIFQSNVIHDNNNGSALFAEISWRVHYLDNIIYNNDIGLEVGESSECELLHNVVFNNGWGVYMRDDGHRKTSTEYGRQSVQDYKKNLLADIPGIDPARVERLGEDYGKYWVTPENFLLAYTNFSDNLVFNNGIGYTEHRRYGQPSDLTIAIHDNRSDYNVFWAASPGSLFGYESGNYAGFTAWQQATGRDLHSLNVDPRAATQLPTWAKSKRRLWNSSVRSRSALDALNLRLVRSPSGAEAMARISRAASVTRVDVGDPQIKAFLFDFAGQKTLGLWTTEVSVRRPLRLKLAQPVVTVEDGYGNKRSRSLRNGTIDLHVGCIPVYLRGADGLIASAR